jgi:hypothetical protein
MSDLKLNTDRNSAHYNDIVIENGDLALVSGEDAVEQRVRQFLNTFLGEWFLDTRVGVPWFQQIMVKNADPIIVDSILKATILNVPGVEELKKFEIDVDTSTREMTLTFKADCDDGDVDFSEVVPYI